MNVNWTRATLLAGVAATLAIPVMAAPTTYQIDPRHSAASFGVTHLVISTVRGDFHGVNGTIVVDDQNISKSNVDVTIDATTIDTREPQRDGDLKSPNFFDVAKYPTITFKSTKIEKAGEGKLKITGDLTIHGVTKQVVLDSSAPTPAIKDPWGLTRRAASATTKINRKDYGLTYNKTLDTGGAIVGDEVTITLDVEMIVPPSAAK